MKRKPARGFRAWTRAPRLWWAVDTVKKSNEFIPLHPLKSLTVREHFHSSCCAFLIVPSDNANTSAIVDHVLKGIRLNEGVEQSATANETKRDGKSTASETAKLLLRGVGDSADFFPSLKSVTRGLCFILENCEVRSSPAYAITTLKGTPANKGERANYRVIGTPSQSAC